MAIDPLSYYHHPMEDIEPLEEDRSRDEAIAVTNFINLVLEYIIKAPNARTAAWQVAYTRGSILCDELPKHKEHRLGMKKGEIARGVNKLKKVKAYTDVYCVKVDDLMNKVLEWTVNAQNTRLAAWQVAYLVDARDCDESMSKKGERLGFGYAAVSKGARDFSEIHGIPPSKWMQTDEYAERRRKQATPTE